MIASAACFESSSLSEGRRNSRTTTKDTNVVSVKKTTDDEKEGKEGYCLKKVKEMVECRICQEEDDLLSLEAPCACNGTLKFAHGKCIQRWCNKKGDITCEICKQVFSPNYSLPPARSCPDVLAIDISYSNQSMKIMVLQIVVALPVFTLLLSSCLSFCSYAKP